jgi:hypothetical protein
LVELVVAPNLYTSRKAKADMQRVSCQDPSWKGREETKPNHRKRPGRRDVRKRDAVCVIQTEMAKYLASCFSRSILEKDDLTCCNISRLEFIFLL